LIQIAEKNVLKANSFPQRKGILYFKNSAILIVSHINVFFKFIS